MQEFSALGGWGLGAWGFGVVGLWPKVQRLGFWDASGVEAFGPVGFSASDICLVVLPYANLTAKRADPEASSLHPPLPSSIPFWVLAEAP